MTSIRVLVAERNPLMRSGVTCLLEEESDITIAGVAKNIEQVLTLAAETTADVILLDAKLPDGSGADILRQLQDQGRPTEIVVITDQADEADIIEFIANGARGLVARKDEPEVILEAIRSVATDHEVWLSPRVAAMLVPRRGRAPDTAQLSARERELLQKLALGDRNEQIAEALGISPGTVRNHLSSIYGKLGIHTQAEAVAWAWRVGLVRPEQGSNQ